MREPEHQDLERLMDDRGGLRLSLYMPIEARDESQLKEARLKELLWEGEVALVEDDNADLTEIGELLRAGRAVREELSRAGGHQGALAAFLKAGESRTFLLPIYVEERVTVGDSYDVRPLLPLLGGRR